MGGGVRILEASEVSGVPESHQMYCVLQKGQNKASALRDDLNLQEYLAHKKTPTPLGTPYTAGCIRSERFREIISPGTHMRGRHVRPLSDLVRDARKSKEGKSSVSPLQMDHGRLLRSTKMSIQTNQAPVQLRNQPSCNPRLQGYLAHMKTLNPLGPP